MTDEKKKTESVEAARETSEKSTPAIFEAPQKELKKKPLDKSELMQESSRLSYLTRKVETGVSRFISSQADSDLKKTREFTVQSPGKPGEKKVEDRSGEVVARDLARPHRLLKGAEQSDETRLRTLVENFILVTFDLDETRLSTAEKSGLTGAREALTRARGIEGVLSNALHLARLYQHLRYIEEAKKATMLALGIDPDNHTGKQLLKELERVQHIDVSVQSVPTTNPLSKARLRKRVINLTGGSVMVIGDLLIDRLLEGKPERISREAPVLILEHVSTENIPGGAANTAHNVTALGGKCHTVGICGADEFAEPLAKCLEDHNITHSLLVDESRVTTVKTRIISKSHSLMQQLLRIDRISHEKVSAAIEKRLIEKIEEAVKKTPANAIILSDYKAGVITDGVIAAVRELARSRDIMVIVDAQGDFERFKECTLMTPNQPDAEAYADMKISDRASLQKLGDKLLQKSGVKALLVTRGGEGMVLFQKNAPMFEIPAFNKSDVFDVTGAGDTVVATMALALTSGATMEESMALGNLAASIVVRKPGTAVTSQREMLDHLDRLDIPD